jgi:NAD(P)H-dependent FMN reductase
MSKNIQLIIGSTRHNRLGAQIAEWVQSQAASTNDITIEVIDLLDVDLPFFNSGVSPMYAPDSSEVGKAWAEKIENGDGFIFVTPEYNRSIPAPLKNAIDYLYAQWLTKPAAIVSYGWVDGGTGAAKHLHDILSWVKMDVAEDQVHLKLSPEILNDNGLISDAATAFADYEHSLANAIKEVSLHQAKEAEPAAA